MKDAMESVEKIRILVGLNVDKYTVKIIDKANMELKYEASTTKQAKDFFRIPLKISQKRFAESDEETIKVFENNFVANLKDYEYTSISNIGAIEISRDNYMPVVDRFDMKFDSSASDNIRAIWSYTLALLQTSEKQIGNHPGVLIFDEPTQHNIGAEDANAFFKSIIALGNKCQVIVGITVNNADIKNVISNLEPEKYKYIHIGEKAFV